MHFRSTALVLLFSGLMAAADIPNSNFTVVDEIVAKVNGDIVTKSELDKTAQEALAALQQQQKLRGEELQQAYDTREKDVLRNRI